MPSIYPNVINEVLRIPGFLYWNTTNLDSESGYGKLLGYTEQGIELRTSQQLLKFTTPESGDEVDRIYTTGSTPQLLCVLKNYQPDALSAIFPGLSSSAELRYPGNILAGQELSNDTHSKRLLFVPENLNNPCVLLQKACANVSSALKFSRRDFLNFPVIFDALRKTDDPDGVYYVGDIQNGVLR